MAKVVGDIAVEVSADIGPLQKAMAKGSRGLNDFGNDATRAGVKFAKMGAAAAAAAAAVGVAVLALARNAAESAKEVQNLSRVAGISAEEFQKLAIAGDAVGISQEKMADIIKDVNDKFGDFMATGAGPLADFFENIAPAVGVTAEQFARLSGPEALQLYVRSLEQAGVSQQQMTFYMEALASDATALLPVLADNGRALTEIGRQAEATGRILSNEMIAKGAELDRKFAELSSTIRTQATAAILEYSDEIIALSDWVANVGIPALVSFAEGFVSFSNAIQPAIQAMVDFMGAIGDAYDGLERLGRRAAQGVGLNDGLIYVPDDAPAPGSVAGPVIPDAEPAQAAPAAEPLRLEITPLPQSSPVPLVAGSDGAGGGGGGASGPSRDDFEAFAAGLATEAEQLEIWRAEQLEKLREFRDAKLTTAEEYDALEAQIAKEHADKLAQIEAQKNAVKLAAVQGAFGDLSSLMSSQNEKLFKIGKAAAVAESVVNGYKAAVSAYDKGMKVGGPPVAAAFAAASLARTGAMISSIASQQVGGGTSSGGGGGGGSVAAAPAPAPLDVRLSGINSGDIISGADLGSLLTQLNEEAGDRGYTILVPS